MAAVQAEAAARAARAEEEAAAIAANAKEAVRRAKEAAGRLREERDRAQSELARRKQKDKASARGAAAVEEARGREAAAAAGAVAEAVAEAERRAEAAEEEAERRAAAAAEEASQRVAEAEAEAARTKQSADEARAEAGRARSEAAAAREAAIEMVAAVQASEAAVQAGEAEVAEAQRMQGLYALQAERAQRTALKLKQRVEAMPITPADRTPEQWAELSATAERQARKREVDYLKHVFGTHAWRVADLATALDESGLLSKLFGTKEHNVLYFDSVRRLVRELEYLDFGPDFGLFLHFEMNLTLGKITQLTQAASKRYSKDRDYYASKVLLRDPHCKSNVVLVPRIAPPRSRLEPIIISIRERLGIEAGENGRVAFVPIDAVIQELLTLDPGRHAMPPLSFYMGGKVEVPIVISHDATGHGQLQLTTIVVKNPWQSHSAEALYVFGLGNVDDGKAGTVRLLGPNRAKINEMIRTRREHGLVTFCIGGVNVDLAVRLLFVHDVSALRHCQLLANSGFCGCSREFALRKVPERPTTVAAMKALAVDGPCRSPTARELTVLGHRRVDGKLVPCTAEGCSFAHDPATAEADEAAMLAIERKHLADIATGVKGSKERHRKWRMEHAEKHANVQPGEQGEAVFAHDMDDQILDALHFAELNLPKLPWKHGVLNNASDDAREAISEQLKAWGYPLDTRRKDNNRVRAQKWFGGEAWASFVKGYGKSPGGPVAIATLVLIIAG